MTLADPLPAADLMDLLMVEDVIFVQALNQQRSVPGAGDARHADRHVALWKAEITTVAVENAIAEGIMARVNSRGGGLKTVLLYNSRLPYPSTDPDGTILTGATPSIKVKTDQLHVSFEGAPAGLVLPFGTYFGIIFGTTRRYLGQLAETATANGSGDTGTVEFWPPLPASVLITDAVSFSKPVGKFTITPGTAYPTQTNALYASIKLSAEQTYR